VRVTYDGGYNLPLTLDASLVTDPGGFGFEVGQYNASGVWVDATLASVTVAGGEAVLIRTSADLPAGELVVRYAYRGGTSGGFSGRTSGARGCLQAPTGRTFTNPSGTTTEFLRPPIHQIYIEAA